MTRAALALALALLAAPAPADTERALADHVLPGHAAFAEAAGALETAAEADCRAEAVRPAYGAAFDAWMGVAHLRIGPTEAAAPAIAFWPDPNGAAQRAVSDLLAAADDAALAPERMVQASVAGRGLLALDRLLADPSLAGYGSGDYACRLVEALAADLAAQARALEAGWAGFAETMRRAGEPGNDRFLAPREALGALYTQLVAGLTFNRDERLGRPMGTLDRPRPTRAEAWRSERAVPNLAASLVALRDLARALAPGAIPETEAAFGAALEAVGRLRDPGLQDLDDPQGWLRADAARSRLDEALAAVEAEIGAPLGLSAGFNSQDGD